MAQLILLIYLLTTNLVPQISPPATRANALFSLSEFKLIKPIQLDLEPISASHLLVKEINGQTIAEKRANEPWPIASLTKLMTVLQASFIFSENETFTISSNAVKNYGEAGKLKAGMKLKRDELIKLALIASSNDAAYTLAEKNGLDAFIASMNQTAQSLNLKMTKFVDPTGLSAQNQSSLADLYVLSDYILRNYPMIFSFSVEPEVQINGFRSTNLNYLLPYYKDIIIGSKTGFINESGENLILLVKFPKSPFIFIGLLNSKHRLKDAEAIITQLKIAYE
jgi:D-alanyl-D-alanine endopeptidase (penicillin-binding protein 7)